MDQATELFRMTGSFLNMFMQNNIFLDFDGVIKDSITIKSDAFAELFASFGDKTVLRVRDHHESNGGLSRYEKIPLYLEWAGERDTGSLVQKYCEQFSKIVTHAVIDSHWVSGAQSFLESSKNEKVLFLLTATPQKEIEEILKALQIAHCFKEVHGAPADKTESMSDILCRYTIDSKDAVMVGDSKNDYVAAVENGIDFILRKTRHNADLQSVLECQMIIDFTE